MTVGDEEVWRRVGEWREGSSDLEVEVKAGVMEMELDRLRIRVEEQDALLEAAQGEIERLRQSERDAIVREARDRDEILEVGEDALARLRVAEEALKNLPRLTLAVLQGRCDAVLAKIRGGAR